MIRNKVARALVGALLGACTGLSLCLSILPLTLFQAGIGDEIVLARLLSQLVVPMVVIWTVGGWAVTRTGRAIAGGLVLGATGLSSGLFAVAMALQPAPKILAVGGITGLIYGFLGGLLLGRVLSPTADDETDDDTETETT